MVVDPELLAAVQNRDARCWETIVCDWRFALMAFEEQHQRFPVSVEEVVSDGLLGYMPVDANGHDLVYRDVAEGAALSASEIGVALTPDSVKLWQPPMQQPSVWQRGVIVSSVAALHRPGEVNTKSGFQSLALWLQTDYRLMTFTSLEGRLPATRAEFEQLTRSRSGDWRVESCDGMPGLRILVDPQGTLIHVDHSSENHEISAFEEAYSIVPGPYQFQVSKTGRPKLDPDAATWPELASFRLAPCPSE
ncbi:MAG: hypothetical protein ABI743_00735 [bacterium]